MLQAFYGNSHPGSAVTSLLTGDPHKLDSVKRAADNIIREKDTIIDRLGLIVDTLYCHLIYLYAI